MVVLFCSIISAAFFLGRYVEDLEDNIDRSSAAGKLSQLKVLLNDYFSDHGHYPSGKYLRNPGEPQHSWRLLLLPYMGEDWLNRYHRYDFSKRWDHPDNISAMDGQVPELYRFRDSVDDSSNFLLINSGGDVSGRYFYTSCVLVETNANIILIATEKSSAHWMAPDIILGK